MLNHILQQLEEGLNRTLPQADGLLSITIPLAGTHLQNLPHIPGNWLFWSHPGEDHTLLGRGEAQRITATGRNRLEDLSAHFGKLQESWLRLDPSATEVEPATFLMFAFSPNDPMQSPWDGLPNATILLPELLLQQRDNHCTASFTIKLQPILQRETILKRWQQLYTELMETLQQSISPPGRRTTLARTTPPLQREQWQRLITAAQESIASKQLEKVVLARHLRVKAQRHLNPAHLMATLRCLYPDSRLFAANLNGRRFAAATPELLAACHGSQINCSAIGGTIQRDANEQQDRRLGEQLLQDPKAQHEHALVVESIQQALTPLCTELQIPPRPQLLRLRNLQHLESRIYGSLKPGIGLLDTAHKLHPTAAVNGAPTAEARAWLGQHEPFSRGWYSGAGGWINAAGDGELAVLLRCALIDGDSAELFAGAGITAGSDPDAEFEEIELKFGVMLEALENS